MKLWKLPLIALAFLLAFAVAPKTVLAHEESGDNETARSSEKASETVKRLLELRREAAEKRREAAKQAMQNAREDSQQQVERFKKACENRRASYKNRLENIAERAEKHVTVLDKITERVKTFKESKNLTVENYDALLAEVAAKKAVVHDLQQAAKEQAEADFNCERAAAFEQVKAFGDILHQQINALKDYKTAVKNLIVAVKQAAEQASTSNED